MPKNLKLLFGCGGLAGMLLVLLGCCFIGLLVVSFASPSKAAYRPSARKLVRLHLPTLTPTLLPIQTPLLPVELFPSGPAAPTPISTSELRLAFTLTPEPGLAFLQLPIETSLTVEPFTPVPAVPTETATPELVLVPTPLPAETLLPLEVFPSEPTEVPAIAEVPTETPTPTEVFPTETPRPTPAPATPAPLFTSCDCSGDIYDCDDFDSWNEAQACFEYCQGAGAGDPHKLDENRNFFACEGKY